MRININWSRNEAIQKQTRLGRASNCIVMSALRSGLHRSSSISCCGREQNKKAPARRRRPGSQNTNNFNDNLNNKTIFSLNATNRARWSIFLVHRFFSARTIFSFCAIGRRWKMWWRIFLAALARYAGRSLSAKNLSKRETRDRRRGSAFSPSRESILFFEKFY